MVCRFGDFPPLILDATTKFAVLAVLGTSDAFFSFFLGRVSDHLGRFRVIMIGYVSFGVVLSFFMLNVLTQENTLVFFIGGVLLGLGDAAFNTQVYAILGAIWSKNTGPAIASILCLFIHFIQLTILYNRSQHLLDFFTLLSWTFDLGRSLL